MIIREFASKCTPHDLAAHLAGTPGLVLVQAGGVDGRNARFTIVTAKPFLTLCARGSQCEISAGLESRATRYGSPWLALNSLLERYELLDGPELPLPLGGCFGFWGYGMNASLEARVVSRAAHDLEVPDCHLGFYGSLVAFDRELNKTFVICSGLSADGSRCASTAKAQLRYWRGLLQDAEFLGRDTRDRPLGNARGLDQPFNVVWRNRGEIESTMSRTAFLDAVRRAQAWIRSGDIYQVNLSQRLSAAIPGSPWELYMALCECAEAPFSAFLDCGEFQLASCSPELFLQMNGRCVVTRPIKGTRPKSDDQRQDLRLSRELLSSAKERAELVMITDLLRNDLGRVCAYGSIRVPELTKLEDHGYVKHLVSTVEGDLRPDVTHAQALAACFPGGSVTGAPKIRAMQIIEELEPVFRGPYTGALGYLGFNSVSQLSIIIRTALVQSGNAYYSTGAGIVADSEPAAEYEETLVKARIFHEALGRLRERASKAPVV